MNKKVSTLLTVAIVLGGSLLSNSAFAQPVAVNQTYVSSVLRAATIPSETLESTAAVNTSTAYVLIVSDQVLVGNEDGTVKKTDGSSLSYVLGDKSMLWTLKIVDDKAKTARLVNVATKKEMLVDGGASYVTITLEGDSESGWQLGGTSGEVTLNGGTIATDVTTVKFALAENKTLTAAQVNDINRGSFTLSYAFDKDHPATNNPFDKELKAFTVNGTEIYLATAWPSSLDDKTTITSEELKKCTVIVADPSNDWNINELKVFGLGATFKEISGNYLEASGSIASGADAEDLKALKAGKFAIENAQFAIAESVNAGGYVLSLAEVFGLNDDKDNIETAADLNIALVADQDKRIVTTIPNTLGEVTGEIKLGASIVNKRSVEVKNFLKADKASVFNIKFLSQNAVPSTATEWTPKQKATMSEYNKYLCVDEDATNLFAQGAEFVNLNAPENQWIIVDADPTAKTFTFANREQNAKEFTVELATTEDGDNVYKLVTTETKVVNYAYVNTEGVYTEVTASSGNATTPALLTTLNGALVELTAVTPNAEAGYVTNELDNAGLVRLVYNATSSQSIVASDLFVTVDDDVAVNQDESKAAQFTIVKFDAAKSSTALTDSIRGYNDVAVWNSTDKKVDIKYNNDTVAVVSYAFKLNTNDGTAKYLGVVSNNLVVEDKTDDETSAARFVVKVNKNGSYSLVSVGTNDEFAEIIKNGAKTFMPTANGSSVSDASEVIYYDYKNRKFDFNILKETPGVSYNHVPQHVTMEAVNGGYVAMDTVNNDGIIAPVSTLKSEYTKEDLTFWLDTLDSEAVTPSFMISKAGNYMYNATDSLTYYNESTASEEKADEFGIQVGGSTALKAKAIFQTADFDKVTEEDMKNYKFQIVQSEDEADEYVIRSLRDYSYVAAHNQKLYFANKAEEALRLTITPAEAPTSNEGVSATEVKVVAQDGAVVVKNAAGKNVVVSTILGQVVANEVLTSDNATINVPAGIVVVAVEGESFKVNVK